MNEADKYVKLVEWSDAEGVASIQCSKPEPVKAATLEKLPLFPGS